MSARATSAALVLLLAAASCGSTPYRPLQTRLQVVPDDAFDRVLVAVRPLYPELQLMDREGFRLRSDWVPDQVADRVGQRRATVFLERPDLISVIVETRYLGTDLLGTPGWSTPRGDPRLERELMNAIEGVLRP